MYNLFIKDYYLVRKHLWIAMFYSFMLFFLFHRQVEIIQGMIYSVGTTMIGYTMIMYTTVYDDKNNSEVLLNSLPISRSKIVLSRYLSIFIFAILGFGSMVIAGFVLKSFNALDISKMLRFQDFVGGLAGICIITFMYLPMYFKFGYGKAKMFNLLLFAIAFSGPILFERLFNGVEKSLWIKNLLNYLTSQSQLVMGLFFIAIILLLGSISLSFSIFVYKKREF